MQLLKVLLFACLIYGTSARDWFGDLIDPYIRRLIEDNRALLNRECKNIIEGQRGNLRNGWPNLGIAPFDPINIDRLELPLGSTNIELVNAQLRGIADFNIDYCDLKVLGLYASISLRFDNLTIAGQHKTSTPIGSIIYHGEGDLKLSFIKANVTLEVDVGVISGNRLNLENFRLDVHVEKVEAHLQGFGLPAIDTIVSSVIGEVVKLAINTGELLFEVFFSALIYPLNVALNEITLPDFLARIIEFIRRYN